MRSDQESQQFPSRACVDFALHMPSLPSCGGNDQMKKRPKPSERRQLPLMVAIGGEDLDLVDRIAEVVSGTKPGLKICRFTPRRTIDDVLQPHKKSGQKWWILLVFICTDPPSGPRLGSDEGTNLLEMAKELAEKPTLKIVAISHDPATRFDLLANNCVAALTLEEALARIPGSLTDWLTSHQ